MRMRRAGGALALLALWAGGAAAIGSGRVVLYEGGGAGKVNFDGRTHAAEGFGCTSCHTSLFAMRKQALITMADHTGSKACFGCHNGQRAFNECEKCHRKM